MESFDTLIVGRGIAGNTLALTLLNQGQKLLVVDKPYPNSPSRLAAGLFSPFTGKHTTKTWMANVLFPHLESFYSKVEAQSGIRFFYPLPAYRPFLSTQQYNEWTGSGQEENSAYFLNPAPVHDKYSPWIHNPLGGIEYKHSGYIDTEAFLKAGEQLLLHHRALISAPFSYDSLLETEAGLVWDNKQFRDVVFCEGAGVLKNPYFPNLPVIPNKGEILTLAIDQLPLEEIITQGVFLVRKKENVFQAGSTYRWKFDSEFPEEKGAKEMEDKLKKWLKSDFKRLNLQAGIRPASKDRRPILGFLDQRPHHLIFNGLGTKGVSLAPYWAEQLALLMTQQKDLPREVDIRRFYLN